MEISKAKFNELYHNVEELRTRIEDNDLLKESEAAELLDISVRTIRNYVCDGTIPPSAYTTGVRGKRFYDRSKLMRCNSI